MRRAPRRTRQGAATAAKALAVAAPATVAAVALTFAAAGPAVAANQVPLQAPATVQTAAAKVKYYVVPPDGHRSVPTLYSIAAATLGNGSRFMEIFNLNKGRLQPNGQRLENPHSVEPGWILLLPPDASGPGVHFGPLPATAKATSRVIHRHAARSQAAPAASSAAASAGDGSGTIAETVIGSALLVFAAAGLGLVVRRRRRAGGGSRRTRTHRRDAGPGSDWVRNLATDTLGETTGPGRAAIGARGRGWPTADHSKDPPADHPSWPTADHSSWPAHDLGPPVPAAVGYGRVTGSESQDWPYPDHPSWPANSQGRPLTPDHPSWPANDIGPPVPAADYGQTGAPDRRSWPYPDHPSWPASDLGRPVSAADDYPSWPATGPGHGRAGPAEPAARPGRPLPDGGAGLPQRERPEPSPTVHHDLGTGQAVAQVPPARGRHVRVPAGYSGQPGPDGPADDAQQRWSAQLARTTGPIPQTYYDLAFGDGRLQVMLTETPAADSGWAAGQSARGGNMLQLPGPGTAGQPGLVSLDTGEFARTDSVRLAERVLADADQQAAAIRQEATSQAVAMREAAEREATEIKQQAAAEAAPVREAAEREAAEVKAQAAAQVAAVREAAEREIAELRATVLAMSADLDQMAACITEKFTGPIERITGTTAAAIAAPPGADPAAPPGADPAAPPGADPAAPAPARTPGEASSSNEEAGPGEERAPGAWAASRAVPAAAPARPGTRPRPGRPATRPPRRTETPARSRQHRAMRVYAGTIAALVVLALGTGAYQLATRGFTFFAFRSAGTGATDNNAIFPGIIPTPKPSPAHHQPTTGAAHHGARRAHHRRHHPGGTHHHATAR